jgi:glucose-6-phosphate 1-epimerase
MGGLRFHTVGAQLLSATGAELVYCSPWSSPNKPARGGVPILFPQFANLWPFAKAWLGARSAMVPAV